eukprot:5503783-Pyramimonas_sp.AAC.1
MGLSSQVYWLRKDDAVSGTYIREAGTIETRLVARQVGGRAMDAERVIGSRSQMNKMMMIPGAGG